MSAETNIKIAYEHVGAKVISMKRQSGRAFRVEIEIAGKKMKLYAKDPAKCDRESKKLFEKSLREIQRSAMRRA